MKISVVGAGVMGLATARVLAQRGHHVTVYEQFELKHKRGSSHGTSRIFRLSYDEEYWIRLAQRAYELWRELEQESGRTLLELDGLVDVQRVPKRRVEALSGAGVPVEELTPGDALERFGFAYDDVESLVFTRDAGIALADATIDALADGARGAGAEILENTRVDALDDVPGERVVVTAGGWAPKLLGRGALDAKPTRETTVYFRGERIPSLIDELGDQFYALTAPGVGVKAGWHKGGRPTDPDEEDSEPDERVVEAVAGWIAQRLPRVDPEPIRAETCIYTNVADESFVCERRGRYVIGSACSGHGFKFAPAVGENLADLAVGSSSSAG
ncbi:MAG: FAD-dependent oxidoreductase [Gaiellaceae bacterium]